MYYDIEKVRIWKCAMHYSERVIKQSHCNQICFYKNQAILIELDIQIESQSKKLFG